MTKSEIPQTPEAVALDLYHKVITAEGKEYGQSRDYILSTYAECLKATTGKSSVWDGAVKKAV